jgi:hypothetical protein
MIEGYGKWFVFGRRLEPHGLVELEAIHVEEALSAVPTPPSTTAATLAARFGAAQRNEIEEGIGRVLTPSPAEMAAGPAPPILGRARLCGRWRGQPSITLRKYRVRSNTATPVGRAKLHIDI